MSLRGLCKLLIIALFGVLGAGCTTHYIPNTDVEDTEDNRRIIDFCEQYRHAVENRNIAKLLQFADPRYYEDGGNADRSALACDLERRSPRRERGRDVPIRSASLSCSDVAEPAGHGRLEGGKRRAEIIGDRRVDDRRRQHWQRVTGRIRDGGRRRGIDRTAYAT